MITQALVANGAKVYITGRREDALQAAVERYSPHPGQIVALPGDITDKNQVKGLADKVALREPKGLQLLVNNAGIAREDATKFSEHTMPDFSSAQSVVDHFWPTSPDAFASTFETNVTAAWFTSLAFLPLLAKGSIAIPGYSTSIINVASISGVMKDTSMGQPAYAASKAALIHLNRMMATCFLDTKVRVNCIAPGLFPSEMMTGESGQDQKSTIGEKLGNPSGRAGQDTDVGTCALLLAGPGGVFLNSQVLYPDGGNTLVQPAAT